MLRRFTLAALGFLTAGALVQRAGAQGGRTPATACALLSLADIRRITGVSGYTDTDATSGSDVAGGAYHSGRFSSLNDDCGGAGCGNPAALGGSRWEADLVGASFAPVELVAHAVRR